MNLLPYKSNKRATMNLSQRLFDGHHAQCEIEENLSMLGVPIEEDIGWDEYDGSIEIYGLNKDYRMGEAAQQYCFNAGFAKIYLNHLDKWETHYSFGPEFNPQSGWRVSYPHKRGEPQESGIWVESFPESWTSDANVVIKLKTDGE